ncbi:hypothetical protein RchiOBHm_Chr2g0127881 [Rosa chinensis]|uniref:Uncharacterized protein n=1 Tax=Rosa chinensis TaxID=74649 RepID=A0A2P6RU58_ROSCH|nr:hypothetical protein RchiOBHm_Chr2g0127881 [Rosa chinensis]
MLIEFESKLSIGVKLWVWQSELFKGAIIYLWEFYLNLVVFFTVEVIGSHFFNLI